MNDGKIESLLNEVKQIVKTHEKYANKQGENFNIFSILRMGRKEVETHSRFIYELLNPKGKHGQDDIFLKSFAENVLGSKFSDSAINPQREDLTDEKRRIDFTLETDANIIGIEMKIDAGDQKNQLFDYHKELKNRADKKGKKQGVKLFYLTLDGSEASKYSLGKLIKSDYDCISFGGEILNWIDDCIAKSAEKSVLREALIQYKILIEKLTGKNTDMNTEIADILKDEDNLKTAIAIEKATIAAKINFQVKFWKDLLVKLGDGFYFGNEWKKIAKKINPACEAYYKHSRNNTQHGVIYNLAKAEDLKLMIIVDHNVYFCLQKIEKYPMPKIEKDNILNVDEGYFYPEIGKLNFKKFDNELIDLLSGTKREETIKNLAQEFKDLVEKLENN